LKKAIKKIAYLAGVLIFIAAGCQSKKNDKNDSSTIINNTNQKTMLSATDFTSIMEKNELPSSYYWDSALLEKQQAIPASVTVEKAFSDGLNAMFTHAENVNQADDFYTMIKTDPESFQLKPNPSDNEIKMALLDQIRNDKKFKIYLLPENIETEAAPDVKLFPPENGEQVADYWIWYVQCDFFPGPAWILVKRDGTVPAYHYGFM